MPLPILGFEMKGFGGWVERVFDRHLNVESSFATVAGNRDGLYAKLLLRSLSEPARYDKPPGNTLD